MDKPCQKRHQQLTTAGCIIGSTVLVRRHAFILCAHVQDAVAVDLEGHLDGKNQGFDFWQDWQPTNNGLVCWGKSSPKFPWIFPWRSWGFPVSIFPWKDVKTNPLKQTSTTWIQLAATTYTATWSQVDPEIVGKDWGFHHSWSCEECISL